MTQEATTAIILSPRTVATGSPAGEALENINTNTLADGSLCYVSSGAQGEWQLQKEATDTPNGTTIVQPISGPGRWFLKISPGESFVPASGMELRSSRVGASVASGFQFTVSTKTEIKATPEDVAAPPTAPFMRASLDNVSLTKLYEIQGTLPLNMDPSNPDSIIAGTLEVSRDGTTWFPIPLAGSVNQYTFSGAAGVAQGQNMVAPMQSPRVLGSSITGLLEGDTLQARMTLVQNTGNSASISIEGGDNPAVNVILRELKA